MFQKSNDSRSTWQDIADAVSERGPKTAEQGNAMNIRKYIPREYHRKINEHLPWMGLFLSFFLIVSGLLFNDDRSSVHGIG